MVRDTGAVTEGGSTVVNVGGPESGSLSDASDVADVATFDAEIPDGFPTRCGQVSFVLTPDAAPKTCAISPADIACNTLADCTSYAVDVSCDCVIPVYGINKTNAVRCSPEPCPPPATGCSVSGYQTQDCRLVTSWPDVAVDCVNHQCLTYASGP
jgi:hypothetical protein